MKYCFPLALILVILSMNSCKRRDSNRPVKKDEYKLAMVQMKVVGGDPAGNLDRAEQRIKEAAINGASLALLPEALDFGWTHTSAEEGAGAIPDGESFRRLSKAAKENHIFVCAGIVERDDDKLYNAAVIIDKNGDLLTRHRKINELDFAHKLYSLGSRVNAVETELGKLGLLICADATAVDFTLAKSLGMMGADIILSPSAWAVPPDHNNLTDPYGSLWISAYKPISKIFDVWYVGVSNVGTLDDGEWTGWNCIGSSLAMDADGNVALQGPYGADADTILYIDVVLKKKRARGTRGKGISNAEKTE